MAFGGFLRSAARGAVKGLKAGIPKLVKGLKSSGQVLTKGLKQGYRGAKNVGQSLISKTQNLFKSTPQPQGIVKETVIKRGTRPVAKIAGKFDETLLKGMKPIQEIRKLISRVYWDLLNKL